MKNEKTYKVVGPHRVYGHQTGEQFKATFAAPLEDYFLTAGHLTVVTGKDAKPVELHCEACQEHGTKAAAARSYKDLIELRDHYAKEHPALAAPTE